MYTSRWRHKMEAQPIPPFHNLIMHLTFSLKFIMWLVGPDYSHNSRCWLMLICVFLIDTLVLVDLSFLTRYFLLHMGYANSLRLIRDLNMYAQISGHSYVSIAAEYSKFCLFVFFGFVILLFSLIASMQIAIEMQSIRQLLMIKFSKNSEAGFSIFVLF